MSDVTAPLCQRCRWKLRGLPVCEAFPKRIPKPIASGEIEHRSSYPGDHDIHFTPLPGKEG